jgi:transposase
MSSGSSSGWPETGRALKKAARQHAHLVFVDETGFRLTPLVQRSWAPVGQTPVLHHRGGHREKISGIGALTISPRRRRLNLYMHLYQGRSVQEQEFVVFLRDLLRHLRGNVIIIWDRLNQHLSREVKAYVAACGRVILEYFPPYAPELNPVEYLWTTLKCHRLANHGIGTIETLEAPVVEEARRVRPRQDLLRSFIDHSPLSIRLSPRGHSQRRGQ